MADRFPIIIESNEQQIQELSAGDGLDLTRSGVVNANYVHSAGVNAGVVTATSFIGDGSQITNIPAGGGSLEATASGTLSDGSTVIVNADGTVSVVAQTETTGAGVGDLTTFESADSRHLSATYDSTNGKVVIAYQDYANSLKGTAIVGTVSGTSISFGSPVVFESGATYHIRTAYDSTNQKVVITYYDDGNSGYGTAIVGTVSGTSISFGSSVTYNDFTDSNSVIYDSVNQKIVIAFRDNALSNGQAIVGTISGTSISFGSPVEFESGNASQISATFDSTNGKVVIAYQDQGNSNYGTAVVGTVSGTSISFGSPVVFESASSNRFSSTFDSTNGKVVIAYVDVGNSNYGTAIVGTVSGTSISFGSPVVFDSNTVRYISATYDSVNSKVLIAFRGSGETIGMISVGTVSGTSISFTTMTFKNTQSDYNAITFDSANGKAVIAFSDADNMQWYGKALVFSTTGYPVHQLGSPTAFESASTDYPVAVYDSTNQKVVITYRDRGNSNYGTAIVGTVSGTSISFGTPVVFDTGSASHSGIAYDSTTNQIVVAFRDGGNSNYGTAIVGAVSGTSISFGSKTVYNTADSRYNTVAYDSSNNKVVIAFKDYTSNLQYGRAIVGTISGTSISFGSKVTLNSANTFPISAIYDPSNQKVVVAYQDYGNSSQGTVRVGTVSGTSISFGSEVVFDSSASDTIGMAYDSTNGKIVLAYTDHTNNWYGTAVVGEVSGTSMTFGTPVVYNSTGQTYYHSAAYDSTNQKVVIAFKDNTSTQGAVITGTISGNSISFGSPVVYETSEMYYNAAVYDSSNDRVVISYMDRGDNDYGKSVVFSPLTISNNLTSENFIGISDGAYTNGQTATIQIAGSVDDAQSGLTPGQQYYVQNDGTLSETADNPSVLAGTAVAATKLMIG